jgi:hypothetical protein
MEAPMFDRSSYPTFSSVLCAVSLGLFSGCASDSDAVEKRLSQLRDDIRKLQNDNDRVSERLEAVELRQAHEVAARNAPKAPGPAAETVSRPRLKVLRLSPEGEKVPADAATPEPAGQESAPRMILKGQGKELELRPGESSQRATPREKPVAVSQNEGPSPSRGAD